MTGGGRVLVFKNLITSLTTCPRGLLGENLVILQILYLVGTSPGGRSSVLRESRGSEGSTHSDLFHENVHT